MMYQTNLLTPKIKKQKDKKIWMQVHDTIQDQDHPQEKEMQKGKMGCLRRPYK